MRLILNLSGRLVTSEGVTLHTMSYRKELLMADDALSVAVADLKTSMLSCIAEIENHLTLLPPDTAAAIESLHEMRDTLDAETQRLQALHLAPPPP